MLWLLFYAILHWRRTSLFYLAFFRLAHFHFIFTYYSFWFSHPSFFCLSSSFAFNRFFDFRHVIKYSILCLCAGCCGSKYLRALQWIVVFEDVVFIYKYTWKYLHSSILNDSWAYAVCIAAILMCTPMYVWKITMRNSKIRKFLSLQWKFLKKNHHQNRV